MGEIDVVPVAVGVVARTWDEQHLDLRAAARQAGALQPAAFGAEVAPAVADLAAAWQVHLDGLAMASEALADGLRRTIAGYLAADRDAHAHLGRYLLERR